MEWVGIPIQKAFHVETVLVRPPGFRIKDQNSVGRAERGRGSEHVQIPIETEDSEIQNQKME